MDDPRDHKNDANSIIGRDDKHSFAGRTGPG